MNTLYDSVTGVLVRVANTTTGVANIPLEVCEEKDFNIIFAQTNNEEDFKNTKEVNFGTSKDVEDGLHAGLTKGPLTVGVSASIKVGSSTSIKRTIDPGEEVYFYKSFTVKKYYSRRYARYEFIDKGELVQDTTHPDKVGAVFAKDATW